MVWVGISYHSKTNLYFIKPGAKINGVYYQKNVIAKFMGRERECLETGPSFSNNILLPLTLHPLLLIISRKRDQNYYKRAVGSEITGLCTSGLLRFRLVEEPVTEEEVQNFRRSETCSQTVLERVTSGIHPKCT